MLGIPSTASAGEARRAYLSLVRLHHPDVNPGSRQFDAVVTAYRALGGVLPAGAPAQRVDVYA